MFRWIISKRQKENLYSVLCLLSHPFFFKKILEQNGNSRRGIWLAFQSYFQSRTKLTPEKPNTKTFVYNWLIDRTILAETRCLTFRRKHLISFTMSYTAVSQKKGVPNRFVRTIIFRNVMFYTLSCLNFFITTNLF